MIMNNKVMMSLVAASIAAMAAAPDLIKENPGANAEDTVIKINKTAEASPEIKADLQNQVNAILAKKAPVVKLSESISVLVGSYGDENGSLQNKVYKELNLGINDSTGVAGGAVSGLNSQSQTFNACHTACHGACHSACHGSRGWR